MIVLVFRNISFEPALRLGRTQAFTIQKMVSTEMIFQAEYFLHFVWKKPSSMPTLYAVISIKIKSRAQLFSAKRFVASLSIRE